MNFEHLAQHCKSGFDQCIYLSMFWYFNHIRPYHQVYDILQLRQIQTYCRSLMKVKFSTDQLRPALGSCGRLVDGLLTMLKKPRNRPISDFFDLTPKYFLVFLHYTDLVPPSTDPVPPSTNQYRPILTQYHHGSTITALY